MIVQYFLFWGDLNNLKEKIYVYTYSAKYDIPKLLNIKPFCLKHLWIYDSEMHMM